MLSNLMSTFEEEESILYSQVRVKEIVVLLVQFIGVHFVLNVE